MIGFFIDVFPNKQASQIILINAIDKKDTVSCASIEKASNGLHIKTVDGREIFWVGSYEIISRAER